MLDRAQRGDETALPAVREWLKNPAFLDACGDLARHAEDTLVRKYAGTDLAVREGLFRKLASLRAELEGPSPSPLERLLAQRIVACWLHLHLLELTCASRDGMGMELANHYQRCIDRAHKRYLAAIKTLAQVRKLAVPVLQVNIARKQVNVAGPCVAADKEKCML